MHIISLILTPPQVDIIILPIMQMRQQAKEGNWLVSPTMSLSGGAWIITQAV